MVIYTKPVTNTTLNGETLDDSFSTRHSTEAHDQYIKKKKLGEDNYLS